MSQTKESIRTIVRELNENLQTNDKVYHAADSEFYTSETLQFLGPHTFWISRVPSTIALVKELENGDLAFTISGDPRYSFSQHLSDYANIHQKWVVFHSQMMHDRP